VRGRAGRRVPRHDDPAAVGRRDRPQDVPHRGRPLGPVSVRLCRRAALVIRRAVSSPTGFALLGLDLRVRDGRPSDAGTKVLIDRVS
jgi:hypothetical protein